jgi:hypothetical protein
MSTTMNIIRTITLSVVTAVGLTACPEDDQAKPVKNVQAKKAAEAANSIRFTENAEIENIKKRLELTANPGLLGYAVLVNDMGQPLMYTGVKGKITSSGKRLTTPYEWQRKDCGASLCDRDLPGPSDEGTYGSSGEYVYFWAPSGQYFQWNGKLLYSDKPFRLTAQPLVMTIEPGPTK